MFCYLEAVDYVKAFEPPNVNEHKQVVQQSLPFNGMDSTRVSASCGIIYYKEGFDEVAGRNQS